MRKLTIATGLALSLLAGAAAGAAAVHQPPRDARAPGDTIRQERGPGGTRGERGGRRGPEGRGPEGALLRGITLTDAQQRRLAELRASRGADDRGGRERFRQAMTEARAARERGDSAAATAKMAELRTEMAQQRDRDVAALRGLLTPDQLTRFDANVAELEKREAERGPRGSGQGGPRERGDRDHARDGEGRPSGGR